MQDDIERVKQMLGGYNHDPEHAALYKALCETIADAERYTWLRCGGWEVLQNPKYWTPENKFDGAVDAAMLDVALNAAQERANNQIQRREP